MKVALKHWREVNLLEIAPINAKLIDPRLKEYRQMILVAPDHIESGTGRIISKVTAEVQSAISGKYYCKKNSVIYSKIRPYLRKAAIVYEDVLCSADMYPLECTSEITPEYLLNILLSDRFTAFANSCSNRTGIPKINRKELSVFKVNLPPISEQTNIADLLSTWDAAIEKTEKQIAAKEKRFLWLLSRLISDKTHPRGHIRDFATEISRRNRDGAVSQVLSVTNHSGFVLPEDQFERRVASSNLSNYKIVTRGQYAYNPSRINVGSIARLNDWDKGVLSPMYVAFELDENKIDSDFFHHWLSSHEAKQRIKNSAQGSVRETVSFGDFASIPFPLPPQEQQQAIARTLNIAQQEITLLKELVDAYRQQKRGLMQKLLTGQWRVKS